MADDISKIKIGSTTYNIKDTTARNSINGLPKIKWGDYGFKTGSTYKHTSSAISYGITYSKAPHVFTQLTANPRTTTQADSVTYDTQTNANWLMGLTFRILEITTTSFKAEMWNRNADANQNYRISWVSIGI